VTPSTGTTDLSQSPYSRTSGTLDGWAFFTPTGNTPRFLVSDGSGGTGSTGAVFSYGASGSSERALGSLASGANISKIGVTLVNNTASTISSFTVTFDGEIWHRGDQATTVNKLAFDYEI